MYIAVNRKVKKKLDSFEPEQLEHIVRAGTKHFCPVEIAKPLDNIRVPIKDEQLGDRIAELSLLNGIRQNAVVGSILTAYCSQFRGTESLYQSKIHYEIGGQREVKTPVGIIDVLTDKHIVEVKEAKDYKHAIGQVICYSLYKPNRQKVIALFGKVSNKLKGEIEYCCGCLDIDIWWV